MTQPENSPARSSGFDAARLLTEHKRRQEQAERELRKRLAWIKSENERQRAAHPDGALVQHHGVPVHESRLRMGILCPTILADLPADGINPEAERAKPPTEERDDDGFIIKPLDEAAYIPMSKILAESPEDWKLIRSRLTRMLDGAIDLIRQWRPSGRRRRVHRADWDAVSALIRARVSSDVANVDDNWAPSRDEIARETAKIRAGEEVRKLNSDCA